MKKDRHTTKVVVRIFRSAPCCAAAFFPEIPGTDNPNTCSSYVVVGGHSSADTWTSRYSRLPRPGNKEDQAEVKRILYHLRHHYGYRLKIVKRIAPAHRAARVKEIERMRSAWSKQAELETATNGKGV